MVRRAMTEWPDEQLFSLSPPVLFRPSLGPALHWPSASCRPRIACGSAPRPQLQARRAPHLSQWPGARHIRLPTTGRAVSHLSPAVLPS